MAEMVHLRAAGCSVVVDVSGGRLPRVLHWGADLGIDDDVAELLRTVRAPWVGDSAVTYPQPVPILGQLAEGWLETPGISGFRLGEDSLGAGWAPLFKVTRVDTNERAVGGRVVAWATDDASGLALKTGIELTTAGLVKAWAEVGNVGETPYALASLGLGLPVPDIADELLDFTGRWSLERVPQRAPFQVGTWLREGRGGKPGLEGVGLVVAGVPGFGFRKGQAWAAHLAWGGAQSMRAIRTPYDTRVIRGEEVLQAGEVILQPGQSYHSPDLLGSYGYGLDAVAARFHAELRAQHRKVFSTPRPVTFNTWESCYFAPDSQRLTNMASIAAELGVERFVLDDGWFRGRTDDQRALGDWEVDPERWPDGLVPLAEHVHSLGLQFGLWVEPEMVSPDSDLAHGHPEWLFDAGHGQGMTSRHQWVLDLAHGNAFDHVRGRLAGIIEQCGIDFLKWDHNRYLLDAGHQPGGTAGLHLQGLAAERLMRSLREQFPALEIESCASGGGRMDLGTLQVASRVWPSDCNDPHERAVIVRWANLLVPQEMIGTHLSASPDHITGRQHGLGLRAMMALWGNFGIELDLTHLCQGESEAITEWIALHKRLRPLLHAGRAVHNDGEGWMVDGVVADDSGAAVYLATLLHLPPTWPPKRLRLVGLSREFHYEVRVTCTSTDGLAMPPWAAAPITVTGAVLEQVGLEAPGAPPDSALLIEVARAG